MDVFFHLKKYLNMSKIDYTINISKSLLEEAEKFNLNIQKIIEDNLQNEIQKRRKWLEENQESLSYSNEYFLKNGTPISKRKF